MRGSVRDSMLSDLSCFRKGGCDRSSANSQKFTSSQATNPAKPQRRQRKRQPTSAYILEADNPFLGLWNHRFDFIYAEHPDPGTSPNWQTETRYPLSDRQLLQGAHLYGVRHSTHATYAVLDLDRGSPYHPKRDPIAFHRLRSVLEPLGLVADLLLTSSDSNGLHVYLPLAERIPSWKLGIVITTLLQNTGFKVVPGWLEVFPNQKPYSADGTKTRFNAHRLPLQFGSYLLNDELEPTHSSHTAFVRQWHYAKERNVLVKSLFKQTLKQAKRKNYRMTGKAQKFLNDLDTEVEAGWSAPGQTNRLLGRIALRSFVFGHIRYGCEPLTGQRLVDDIVRVAKSLPGFKDFCNHQHELIKKAKGWVRKLAKSHYFPYSSNKTLKTRGDHSGNGESNGIDDTSSTDSTTRQLTWNEQQALEGRMRVQEGVLDLCRQSLMPELTTHRFHRLLDGYGVSPGTLYKNSDLWHPKHIEAVQQQLMNKVSDSLPLSEQEAEAFCAVGAAASAEATSLLPALGRNVLPYGDSSDRTEAKSRESCPTGRNVVPGNASSRFALDSRVQQQVERSAPPKQLVLEIKRALAQQQARQQAGVGQSRAAHKEQQRQQRRAAQIAELQQWIATGEPILVAEAQLKLRGLGVEIGSG